VNMPGFHFSPTQSRQRDTIASPRAREKKDGPKIGTVFHWPIGYRIQERIGQSANPFLPEENGETGFSSAFSPARKEPKILTKTT